ncbi:HlyC/CorC family transporter [Silvimonas sp. JCM 19000]
MDDIPLSELIIALVVCLLSSAFFSASETAMMAVNRFRLNARVQQGHRGAIRTRGLLDHTDRLLGVILLGNTLINTASAALSTVITARMFGTNQYALPIATLIVAFAILVISEATPKVLAANYADKAAVAFSYPLAILQKVFYPAVWFINLFVNGFLKLTRLSGKGHEHTPLSPEELRLLVLESGRFMEKKHQTILLNLFELANITVDDVMTPRHHIEALDLSADAEELRRQLYTCHHTRLPVYDDNPDNMVGILHTRKALSLREEEVDGDTIRTLIRPPYFIPSGTPLFTQLQNFQENRRRIGLVVDEYGELAGLVTLEDILEQIIGEFTTNAPNAASRYEPQADGSYLLDGASSLRELNRKLKLGFPLTGPKTLNGLILEYFEDIPDSGTCLTIAGERLEVVQTQDRSVKVIRLYPHVARRTG